MKRSIIAVSVFILVLLSGCASVDKGRFSVVDFDLRSPEQIVAQKDEKTIIYADNETNKVAKVAGEERAFPFDLMFKFFEVMKGRIMILSLEWNTKE